MGTKGKILYWTPRLLGLLSIAFISLFALDALTKDKTLGQLLADFGMHLIPSAVLLVLLIVAWKREKLGGIIFSVLGLGLTPYVYTMNYRNNESVWTSLSVVALITIPLLVIGLLFLWSYYFHKSRNAVK